MPEGPTIVLLKEETEQFAGRKVLEATGNAKIDVSFLEGKTITEFKSWGKHFLLCFDGFTVRIHFLLFGTYLINGNKTANIRLGLKFNNGWINFYTCQVKLLEGDINQYYDWSSDIMSDAWDIKKAKQKIKALPNKLICDVLLEQDIFSGVGNIIKNEALYRARVHPLSVTGNIPAKKLTELINQTRIYSFEFLKDKKQNHLEEHWLAHDKKICQRCNLPLQKEYTGIKKRRSHFCPNCQKLYV